MTCLHNQSGLCRKQESGELGQYSDRLEGQGLILGMAKIFFSTASRLALRPTHPPIQWAPREISLGVKRPGCEADQLTSI
jgi:hypothetical protein